MGDKEKNVFRRGVMSLVILGLLKREDMYGYQLVQETARLSEGKLTTQEGSLYPVLYRLQEEGLISDKRVQVGKRMTRIYYHLEEAGAQRLDELGVNFAMNIYNHGRHGLSTADEQVYNVNDMPTFSLALPNWLKDTLSFFTEMGFRITDLQC